MTTRQLDIDSPKPVSAKMVRISAWIPPLPQALNGEFGKAAIVGAFFWGGAVGITLTTAGDGVTTLPGMSVLNYAAGFAAIGAWAFSFFDGSMNAEELNSQWDRLHPVVTPASISSRLRIGMTANELLGLLGTPVDVNRTTTAYGVHEQWIYEHGGVRSYYYLEDGKLTAWQD